MSIRYKPIQSLDRTHGGVQVLNGQIYYSPNSCRAVEEPLVSHPGENPFIPSSRLSSRRNVMDLDVKNYLRPQWWSRPWGWISFLLLEPDYQCPPFDPLTHIPRRPIRLPDGTGYAMPSDLVQSWLNLDNQLNVITYFLQTQYEAPAIRPMNPWAFGYNQVFPRAAMMMKAITKSWEWFSVWVALFSFLIAKAEDKEDELESYPHLAKENWAAFLLSKSIERTLLDSLVSSIVFQFDSKRIRAGTFIDLWGKDHFQPSVYWFYAYHVPVWYRWGDREANNPLFADFGPYVHQLQVGTTFFTSSPSTPISKAETADSSQAAAAVASKAEAADASKAETADASKSTDTADAKASSISTHHKQESPPWQKFFESRKILTQRMEQTETERELQTRLNRTRKPPTKSAKVFRWTKDQNDIYIREQVSQKWSEDTLGDYSTKQVRYDPFLNEYDCCSQFGSDDEFEDDEDVEEDESLFIDYDQANKECSTPLTALPESSLDPFDERDGLPSGFDSRQDEPFIPSLDALEEEVLNTAFLFFGYLSPLPAPPQPPLTKNNLQKNFCRFLGIAWNESYSALFNRPRILALVKFVSQISGPGAISPDEWDLEHGSRSCVALKERFKLIHKIQGPNGPLYMFDFQERATVQWKLTLTTASHALLVCRLHAELQEQDLARYLLQNGIPFYTLQDWETLPLRPSSSQKLSEHYFRPERYTFTLRDYVAYVGQSRVFLLQPRARAALLRGGYLWRASVSTVSFNKVISGPTGRSADPNEMFVVTLPDGKRYVDDGLTEMEVSLLLGIYQCPTGQIDQVALMSWCPSPHIYKGSGLDHGRWTTFNESLYSIGVTDIDTPNATLKRQPCTGNRWRNICRGSRDLTRAMTRLERASVSLLQEQQSVRCHV